MTKRQTEKWVIDNPDSPIPTVRREVQLNCKLIAPEFSMNSNAISPKLKRAYGN